MKRRVQVKEKIAMRCRPRTRFSRILVALLTAATITSLPFGFGAAHQVQAGSASAHFHIDCSQGSSLCTEVYDSEAAFGEGNYVGHDEPSLLFYSGSPGSGNDNKYRMTLPKEPPTSPAQDGSGGTDNFQLHPAFWFGMAMCDVQSAPQPNPNGKCTPDSDSNIFDNPDPSAPDYLGNHPGTAFMEMQFYPPGWVAKPFGISCDTTKWCAALTIDSFTENQLTGQFNNSDCINNVTGPEPVNFAFITLDGKVQDGDPANPVDQTLGTFTPDASKDLFMNPGDTLTTDMHDTSAGFRVVIHDLTSGQVGSMTASVANQFGQVNWDPNGTVCTRTLAAYHPMYSTSSEHTRVVWAAHSYNIAFSDEIGHFEYCNQASGFSGHCTQDGVGDTDAALGGSEDDFRCFNSTDSLLQPIGGCTFTDADFDGPEYQNNWPGTSSNPATDQALHAAPIQFSSPLFGSSRNFDRVAFESDLPRVEGSTNPPCQRFSPTGVGCVNPPVGASFYPIYVATKAGGRCVWAEGGRFISGAINTFGGSSTTEYGPLLRLNYPGSASRFNDFRQVVPNNPCPAPGGP